MAEPEQEADSGPGPMLRRAREAEGLSEQQAAERLNLDVAVVAALEREDFAVLGAPVFAKGHLRRYASLLGLAAEDILAAYERAQGQPQAPTLVPRARREMMPVRGRPKLPWILGGALLFLLAAALTAYVSEYGFTWPSRAPAAPEVANIAATDDEPGRPTVDEFVTEPAGAARADGGGAPATAPERAPMPLPPGHVSVGLTFTADSWAEVYDGSGKAVLYDLGRAGTQRAIAAAAPLAVTLGNAPGVAVSVNGRPVDLPAVPDGGTVARFRIEADGSLR